MTLPRASCGWTVNCPRELKTEIEVATNAGFDFIVVPIIHPRYKIPATLPTQAPTAADEKTIRRRYANTRSDLVLSSSEWSTLVAGSISKDLNLESSNDEIRQEAAVRLKWELDYATHLGLPAVIVAMESSKNIQLSKILSDFLSEAGGPQVWVRVPITSATEDPWNWWNSLRTRCDFEKRLGLVLDVQEGYQEDSEAVKRWLGEPIKSIILHTNMFERTQKGHLGLPRSVRHLIRSSMDLKIQFIIEGRVLEMDSSIYQQYLNAAVATYFDNDPLKHHAQGYEDFLQSPLQPLTDNLQSHTYEIFEKDPVKYAEYQRAIYHALLDRVSEDEAPNRTLTLMVLGAGRGPLVQAALDAASASRRKIKVFAVEKNPYAVDTLFSRKEESWGDKVDVISSDMRNWNPTEEEKADIIISELLGSFGDNELSPECLYSAQHLMKSDGISIPYSYTSWVGPVQSSKMFQEVRASSDPDKHPLAHFETPYVVHLKNRFEIAPPQPLFTFKHPIWGPIDYSRYGSRSFKVNQDCVLHGFAGYFECVLYKDVVISTNPATHSEGMFSWFPIFFPLRYPSQLKRGNEIEVNFWRMHDGDSVWYEWVLTKPDTHAIHFHNPKGRSYKMKF